MELRPYQQQAKDAIFSEWENGIKKTLLVLPTGCGKTIVFAKVAEECVKGGSRVLILAHRGELLDQAADKIGKSTGLGCATEKAEQTCLGSWFRIVVGSVQSMMREKRLNQFPNDYFNTIIIDEAHHCISDSYQKVLRHFPDQYNVLCNSMLLTEGWDCPSVDCIVVLRPTKVRSLYCQMVGRGTRLSPETNKDHLLLLDFLWHTERHELCHPASLICESAEVAQKMTENMEKDAGCVIDIEEAEKTASEDVVAQREEALAKQLSEMKRRKKRLVDPLQFEMSIQAEDLSGYVPAFGWEMAPPSEGQKKTLEKLGILPDAIENAGKASKILDRLDKRRREGLTTPKQIRFLESRGFQHVGTWQFETAKNMIDRIAGNGWRVPSGIIPAEYRG